MAELEYEDEGFREMILEIMAETKEQATVALQAAGFHLQTAIVEKLSGRRTGHIYPVPGTRTATYQASAPGEPPAVMLGNLRNSINVSAVQDLGDELSVAVGPDIKRVPYAARLEFGGRNADGSRFAERPYLRNTFLEQEQTIENIIRSELAQ
jgi:phage gpG-like protein